MKHLGTLRGFTKPLHREALNTHTYVHFGLFSFRYKGCFTKPLGTSWTVGTLYTHMHILVFSFRYGGCFTKPLGAKKALQSISAQGLFGSPILARNCMICTDLKRKVIFANVSLKEVWVDFQKYPS